MNYPNFFSAKISNNLFGLKKEFDFLHSLYEKKKLPKVLLFTGNKGLGKSTLINHFLFSIFDEKNYDLKLNILKNSSSFFTQFKNNSFSNIIYIQGSDFKSIKIDDIRNLKSKIFKSTILDKERFIIFDDIELFNTNSLNALLKIIEEPSKKNYFFLVNNNSKPLLETIKSRAIEIKLFLNDKKRLKIIDQLVDLFNIKTILDPQKTELSPGNFIKYNYVCNEYNIQLTNDIIDNLSILLKLYKNEKNILFINIAFFIVEYYFRDIRDKNILNNDKIYEIKKFIFEHLNNFLIYNINQNSLINAINNKLSNE
tara:strand:- start:2746 stop:3681 length:936 start_codon:yes stop_codon:yes gene_type:complete